MRWCRCNWQKPVELQNLEYALRLKEEELLQTNKALQCKKKLLKELDRKTSKLKEAKNKLLVVTKSTERCNKYKQKAKKNKKKKQEIVDVAHNFFDKIFKMDRDMKKVAKINKYDLIANIRRILLQPCARPYSKCEPCKCKYNKSAGSQRRKLFSAPEDCYVMSLQRTPQLWIYHRWPQFYPQYLSARAQWKNLGTCFMFCLGILFWVPFFLCLEICKCCFCSCCCDC